MNWIWILALALALAGCVTPPIAEEPLGESVEGATALLTLEAHDCAEAGGVSLNPSFGLDEDFLPAPFHPADTTPYTGVAAEPGMIGIYHAAFECHAWSVNGATANHPSGGFVGMLVEPPEFPGVEAVEHNVLVATIATRDQALRGVLEGLGLYVYSGIGKLQGGDLGDRWVVQSILHTEGDGIYENDLVMTPGEAIPLLRLWLILDSPDGKLHPAYIDVAQTGGQRWVGQGYFQHSLNSDHPGGFANGAVAGLGFTGIGRAASLTVLPDVMEEMWDH